MNEFKRGAGWALGVGVVVAPLVAIYLGVTGLMDHKPETFEWWGYTFTDETHPPTKKERLLVEAALVGGPTLDEIFLTPSGASADARPPRERCGEGYTVAHGYRTGLPDDGAGAEALFVRCPNGSPDGVANELLVEISGRPRVSDERTSAR